MKTFLSSTYLDLKEHRRAVVEVLERLGHDVGRMEVFGARPDEPTTACLDEVEVCDLFVGVYAHRYGFIPPGSEISITENEFNHAAHLNKPIFCFFVNEDHPWSPKLMDDEPGKSKLSTFRQRVSNSIVRDVFTAPEDLALKVATAVGHYLTKGHLEKLTSQLRKSMSAANLDSLGLANGRTLSDVPEDTREQVKKLLGELMYSIDKLTTEQPAKNEEIDSDSILALAQGLMAEGKWLEAGRKFEDYAQLNPGDLEANYARGVAFANSRKGSETNLSSLRAYNDAIAFAPSELDQNMRARLFAYRGAILKRLGRLDEAEFDLLLAKRYATMMYETDDINYNLAGVYALRGDRAQLLGIVKKLKQSPIYLLQIHAHLDDYFKLFKEDQEFLESIGVI